MTTPKKELRQKNSNRPHNERLDRAKERSGSQSRIPEDDISKKVRGLYHAAVREVLAYLKQRGIDRKEITHATEISAADLSKASNTPENHKKDIGPGQLRSILGVLLETYSGQIGLDRADYLLGTAHEKVIDCEKVINHLSRKRASNRAQYHDEATIHLLVYWWLRDKLFPCLLINEKFVGDEFSTKLYFYYPSGNENSTTDISGKRAPYFQTGRGEIFQDTTSILTIGGDGNDNPNHYRASFNFKIDRDSINRIRTGRESRGKLIVGTYSTVSKRGGNQPICGLLLAEPVENVEEAEQFILSLAHYQSNRLNQSSDAFIKFYHFRQFLFRESCAVELTGPVTVEDLLSKDGVRQEDSLPYRSFAGKYRLTYLNAVTDTNEPLVQSATLEVLLNGQATLQTPDSAVKNGQVQITPRGGFLISEFTYSDGAKYASILVALLANHADNGLLRGVFFNTNNRRPAIGRIHFERVERSEECSPTTSRLSDLEKSSVLYKYLTGEEEVIRNFPFGESKYLIDKYTSVAEPNGQGSTTNQVYRDYAGVYELYSLSSTAINTIQVFPVLIDGASGGIKIRSRNQTYSGKLRAFKNGIIELYFDQDENGSPHFMHKLFLVKGRKITDKPKPKYFFGISSRINSLHELRASQDVLVVSARNWDDQQLVFAEDALDHELYKSVIKSLVNLLTKKKNLIKVSANPDSSFR